MKKTKKKSTLMKKQVKKPIKMSETIEDIDSEESLEKTKADKYKEHGCEFLNEAECEEELDEDGLDLDEVEEEHFEEEKE